MSKPYTPTPDFLKLLVQSGSDNRAEAAVASEQLAKQLGEQLSASLFEAPVQRAAALDSPLRQGVLFGDILSNGYSIFQPITVGNTNSTVEYPLDCIAPGSEKELVAFTIPNQGYIPQKQFEGDYVQIPIYEIAGSVDWLLKYARDANWDVTGRFMKALQSQFVKKMNDDGFHTLIAGAVDRNITVVDADSNPGQFTKRLVSLAKMLMKRNSGGNSASLSRGKLTDIFMSIEGVEDIRNWGIDQVDEITRREIYVAGDGGINRVFGVNLHDLYELGEGQEYQLYFNSLGATLPSGHVELAIGLDLSANDSFIMPTRGNGVEIFHDDKLHRQRRDGYYGWASLGFALLDNRRVLTLAY